MVVTRSEAVKRKRVNEPQEGRKYRLAMPQRRRERKSAEPPPHTGPRVADRPGGPTPGSEGSDPLAWLGFPSACRTQPNLSEPRLLSGNRKHALPLAGLLATAFKTREKKKKSTHIYIGIYNENNEA